MEENEVRKPKNSLEILRWLVFEPVHIDQYYDSIEHGKPRIKAIIGLSMMILLINFFLYLISILIITCFNLPFYFPDIFSSDVLNFWNGIFLKNIQLIFFSTILGFIKHSIIGSILGSIGGFKGALLGSIWVGTGFFFISFLLEDLPKSLITALLLGLLLGLIGGTGRGRGWGFLLVLLSLFVSSASILFSYSPIGLIGVNILFVFVFGFFSFLLFVVVYLLIREWGSHYSFIGIFEVILGLWMGLCIGFSFGIVGGWKYSLMIFIAWIFLYYRIYFYLYYMLRGFFQKYSLVKNPHRWDGAIFFPIPQIETTLQNEAYENPSLGFDFCHFLKKNDRFNGRLIWLLNLSSIAGDWHNKRCVSEVLKDFPKPDTDKIPINALVIGKIRIFILSLKYMFHLPLHDWNRQIETTRLALLDVEQESNARLRVQYFKIFREELDKLDDLALRQPRSWGQYFIKALELWQKTADTKLRDLELEAAAEEPIVANIYRGGEKLRPADKELFLGRDELRDAFKKRVVTATSMPLFFIQGQRRVGKSSLIAFLPTILDRGFRVVAYDMQEHPGEPLPALLQKIRGRIHDTLRIPKDEAQQVIPEQADWLEAWRLFRQDLESIAGEVEAKIVLAIDEYEEFHKILKTDPEAGANLLAAMRSWSQSQNKVVFLFAGAEFFTDLREPNWGEFFVQAERLYVDYLGREDAFKLIQLAGLHYPPELLERMYQDTQGHPCWLQIICRDIVTMVNKTGRESRQVTEADYEAALNRILTDRDDQVMRNFWHQFCQNWGLKDTVRQVLRGERPSDERARLLLDDHRFIIPDGAGWRMRAPIFEGWLRRYQAT